MSASHKVLIGLVITQCGWLLSCAPSGSSLFPIRQGGKYGYITKSGKIAINPNTVSKAYRELEHQGLVVARTGVGTFVAITPSDGPPATLRPLRRDLERWIARARGAGLDDESIEALFIESFRESSSVAAR